MEQDKLATDELTNLPLDHSWYTKLSNNFAIIQECLEELVTINDGIDEKLSDQDKTQVERLKEQAESLQARINRIIMGTDSEAIKVALRTVLQDYQTGQYTITQPYPFKAIVSSFGGDNFNSLDLYWTNDYLNFNPINKSKIEAVGTIRDPSITWFNGKFWLAYTWGACYSEDLINFTKLELPEIIPGQVNWAPEWVIDGNKLYLMGTGGTNGFWNSGSDYCIYQCCLDTDALKFTPWIKMTYRSNNEYENNIDPTATYYNGKWWLAMKYGYHYGLADFSPKIQLYQADQFEGPFNYVTDIPFTQHCEGPSLIVADGRLYCYADGFETYTSWRMESADGVHWQNEQSVTASDGSRTQHFTVLPLDQQNQQPSDIVQKAIAYYSPATLASGIANFRTSLPMIPLKDGVNDLYPRQGLEYYYYVPYGQKINAVVNLHMDNNEGVSKIHFIILDSSGSKIVINRNDAFYAPNGAPTWTLADYDRPVTLITYGSDDSWMNNPAAPYRIVGAHEESAKGGVNYVIGSNQPFTFTGQNKTGQVVAEYDLSNRILGALKQGTATRLAFDLDVQQADNGQLFVGFLGGGTWSAYAFSQQFINGKQHVSVVLLLPRDVIAGDRIRFALDNSAATYTISNVMFESGSFEHEYRLANEDIATGVEELDVTNVDLNVLNTSGHYGFGGMLAWKNGPKTIQGFERYGTIDQEKFGDVITQHLYTNASEMYFREKSGAPAVWGHWIQINGTDVGNS